MSGRALVEVFNTPSSSLGSAELATSLVPPMFDSNNINVNTFSNNFSTNLPTITTLTSSPTKSPDVTCARDPVTPVITNLLTDFAPDTSSSYMLNYAQLLHQFYSPAQSTPVVSDLSSNFYSQLSNVSLEHFNNPNLIVLAGSLNGFTC